MIKYLTVVAAAMTAFASFAYGTPPAQKAHPHASCCKVQKCCPKNATAACKKACQTKKGCEKGCKDGTCKACCGGGCCGSNCGGK